MVDSVLIVGRNCIHPNARAALDDLVKVTLSVDEAPAALEAVREAQHDIVVVGGELRESPAFGLLQTIRLQHPQACVVIVDDQPSTEWAVRFVRAGAYDYISGPLDSRKLQQLLSGMAAERAAQSGNSDRFFHHDCPAGVPMVGRSNGLAKVLEMIRLVSESRCNPILILGETGTGKELAAKAVHAWRFGDSGPFVAVNCATLTANLLEGELFGHVKGAFTGADREKAGLLEAADSGSIFLDEISEMPLDLQAKLLRFLQEKTYRKVGGTTNITSNATIIASSNLALFEQAMSGKFRKDLYYRLAVFPIEIPALRSPDRRADIPLLAEYFLQGAAAGTGKPRGRLTPEALDALRQHDWPGNARELRNVIERAMILEKTDRITCQSILIERTHEPQAVIAARPDASRSAGPEGFSLETAEREFIDRALRESGWQRTRAAALLGITRATLLAKIKRYNIQSPQAPAETDAESLDTPCAKN